MGEKIIYISIIAALFIFCIYFGIRYCKTNAEYKRYIAAQYQRSCDYQKIIAESRNNIERLKEQHRRDDEDYKRIKFTADREKINNNKLTEEIQRLREIIERANGRDQEAIKRIDEIIKQMEGGRAN